MDDVGLVEQLIVTLEAARIPHPTQERAIDRRDVYDYAARLGLGDETLGRSLLDMETSSAAARLLADLITDDLIGARPDAESVISNLDSDTLE